MKNITCSAVHSTRNVLILIYKIYREYILFLCIIHTFIYVFEEFETQSLFISCNIYIYSYIYVYVCVRMNVSMYVFTYLQYYIYANKMPHRRGHANKGPSACHFDWNCYEMRRGYN